MSEPRRLVELCEHGEAFEHNLGWLSPELVEPHFIVYGKPDGMGGLHCSCPGGREMSNLDSTPLSERCGSVYLTKPWEWVCDLPKGHKGEHETVVYWDDGQAEGSSDE